MPDTCKPESVTAQLERIVANPPLASSPSLCRFLRYVVEETLAGRSGSLKEYSLGVEVFERGEAFDPRMDPIVRVQARNLRVRLGQYYSGPGAADPVLIELPKRTYVPVFRSRLDETVDQPGAIDAPTPAAEPPIVPAYAPSPAHAPIVTTGVVTVSSAAPVAGAWPKALWSGPKAFWAKSRRRAFLSAVVFAIALAAGAVVWQTRSHHTLAASRHEPDPTAQDLYIRGRYVMDRQTEPALHEGIDCFRRAVERDPRFASAYAGLADAYNILAQHGYIAPREGMEEARRAAGKALEIDPALAEGHVSLAAIIEAYDWNWSGAEREYKRALELNASLPAAHLWYGMFLRDQGRLQEALPELRRAAQLEPFSVLTSLNLAHAYMLAGNSEAALEQARHVSEVAPELALGDCILASLYGARSQTAEAEAALSHAAQFSGDDPHALAVLARAYARYGNRDEGLRLYHRLEDLSRQRYVSPFDLGTVSWALGDEKRAVGLLEEAFRQRSAGMIFLRDARSSHGHSSPEFDSLIEKMHFAG